MNLWIVNTKVQGNLTSPTVYNMPNNPFVPDALKWPLDLWPLVAVGDKEMTDGSVSSSMDVGSSAAEGDGEGRGGEESRESSVWGEEDPKEDPKDPKDKDTTKEDTKK